MGIKKAEDATCKAGQLVVNAAHNDAAYGNRGLDSCGICLAKSSCCLTNYVTLDGWKEGSTCYMPLCAKEWVLDEENGAKFKGGLSKMDKNGDGKVAKDEAVPEFLTAEQFTLLDKDKDKFITDADYARAAADGTDGDDVWSAFLTEAGAQRSAKITLAICLVALAPLTLLQ